MIGMLHTHLSFNGELMGGGQKRCVNVNFILVLAKYAFNLSILLQYGIER